MTHDGWAKGAKYECMAFMMHEYCLETHYILVSVPHAHAKTRNGVWANGVKLLTKREVLLSRCRLMSCYNHMIKTNMACSVCGFITVWGRIFSIIDTISECGLIFSYIFTFSGIAKGGWYTGAHVPPTADCALPIMPNATKFISLMSVF